MPNPPRHHLFLYGSLLPDAPTAMGAPERLRLQSESTCIGPARTSGMLLNLGEYPGLVDGPGIVHGALIRLHTPALTLLWLDAYEAVTGSQHDEYRRVSRDITLSHGETILAQTYLFIGPRAGHVVIQTGSWLNLPAQNANGPSAGGERAVAALEEPEADSMDFSSRS